MNHETIEMWKDGVMEHTETVRKILEERTALKEHMEEHLKEFFTFSDIEFSPDFNKITLSWEHGVCPIIKHDKIHRLGMDWLIKADYDDSAFRIVVIEVYPFGLEDGMVMEE